MKLSPWPLLLAAAVLTPLPARTAAPTPPNIVLILADDLGYGDLGCYGQVRIPTPRIDRLAAEGMRFTQFYAGSTVCAPSRNVLMTGQHTGHVQVRGNAKVGLRPTDVTVAQILRQAGYATALAGKWGLGAEHSDAIPTRKGFDSFFGSLDQTHAHNYYPTFLLRDDRRVTLRNVVPDEGAFGQGVATVRLDYSDDLIVDEALAVIDRQQTHPFFLYLASTLPHANDENKANGMEVPDLGMFAHEPWPEPEKAFAAMVARLDRDVGRILDRLQERGLSDRTVVILASDNGPHAEGGQDPAFFRSAGPWRGLKRDLYEGGIRVPFIVRWPGQVAPGSVSHQPGYLGDLMATFADLAGAPAPAGLDSVSLLPALQGRALPSKARDYFYWEFYEGASAQAVRFGDWKALRRPMLTGPMELYDLATDPGEQRNLAADHAAVVAKAAKFMTEAHEPSPLWPVPKLP